METLFIGGCDGSSSETSLETQLIRYGLLDRKWSHKDEDTPGSVFYWFKHVVSPIYSITQITEDVSWHCGICHKEIKRKFFYECTRNPVVNLNERYDVRMPDSIVSGSECIKLGDDMKNLLKNLRENKMYVNRLRFGRGRILARDVISAHDYWKVETIALPLRWFYFEDWWRPVIMLGQENSGYGYHVQWQGGIKSVWGNMKKAAEKDRDVKAFQLFRGYDEYRAPVDIYSHGRQSSADDRYVVLTRSSARDMHYEITGRMRKLKNEGKFIDDKR